jgi:hypothetical protein
MPSFKLYEVELRAVALLGERAWAFNDEPSGWLEAPGLVSKAPAFGISMTPAEFAREFPEADLSQIPLNGESDKAAA